MSNVIQIYAVLLEEFLQANRNLTQLIFILGRQRKNQMMGLRWLFTCFLEWPITFQDDVRVCATRTEGADSCAEGKQNAIHLLGFPFFHVLYYVKRRLLEIDEFIQLGAMQGGSKLAILHLQKHLRYADNACRRFQMAYIAFYSTNATGLVLYIVRAESIAQPGNFN